MKVKTKAKERPEAETGPEYVRRITRQRRERLAWEYRKRKSIGLLLDAASFLNEAAVPDGPLQERAIGKVGKVLRMWTEERGKK